MSFFWFSNFGVDLARLAICPSNGELATAAAAKAASAGIRNTHTLFVEFGADVGCSCCSWCCLAVSNSLGLGGTTQNTR